MFRRFAILLFLVVADYLAAANGAYANVRLEARVSLSSQTMTVYQDGAPVYEWPVSTGRKGYTTPTGTWSPTRKHVMWRSRTYDNAPMPYSVFYHRGYAIHGTNSVSKLGRPASHGCIRLDPMHASMFYTLVESYGMDATQITVDR